MFRSRSVLAFAAAAFSLAYAAPQLQAQSGFSEPARFLVANNQIHMQGVIFGSGPNATLPRLRRAVNENPGIKTLVIHLVPGADDDDGALSLYRFVRNQRLNTLIASDGLAASGGVDLFCAGVNRTVEPGGTLLVHPWEDDRLGSGRNVPMNHSIHQTYRTYYRSMGIGEGFYERTLFAPLSNIRVALSNGAVAEIPDMYRLTDQELRQFNLVTQANRTQPNPPNPPNPPGMVRRGQLIGTWNFQGDAGEVEMTLNADSTMNFTVGNSFGGGSYSLAGNQLTINITGIGPVMLMLNGAGQNQLRFGDGTVWQRATTRPSPGPGPGPGPSPAPPVASIDGRWREVRQDGRVKIITIQNQRYLEREGRESVSGVVRINDEEISLPDGNGGFETFLFEIVNGNRVNFMNPSTERMTDFHWQRQ